MGSVSAMRVLMLTLVMLAAALQAQAQEVNRQDPAAVAKAYLEACARADFVSAAKVSADERDIEALHRITTKPTGIPYLQQLLGEVLAAPLLPDIHHRMGEVTYTRAGDECRVPVATTYSRPTTLVLKRNERGEWTVALWDTLQWTGGQELSNDLPGSILIEEMGDSEAQTCQRHLKRLAMAVLMYAQDHDEILPPAETWRDDVLPYVNNTGIFVCPLNPWGYAYNATLAKTPLGQIGNPAETIVLFEVGHVEPNMAGDVTKVKWAHRHNGGDNAGYVDGHVKWLAGQ